MFTENKGQVGDQHFRPRHDVLFSGSDGEMTFYLTGKGISYQWNKLLTQGPQLHRGSGLKSPGEAVELSVYRLDLAWQNCNRDVQVQGEKPDPGYDNFYSPVCPDGVTGVRRFGRIKYGNIYDGIDLVWYNADGRLKYDYLVSAGADYSQISWVVNGALGMEQDKNGCLHIKTPLGELVEDCPVVIQDGKRLQAGWRTRGNVVSIAIADVDPRKPFVIDPLVRLWGTFFGGNQEDFCGYMCHDAADNVIVTGATKSISNIATSGSHQQTFGGNGTWWFMGDAMLVKMNGSGVRLWSTYYGGSGAEYGGACAVDLNGNIYVVGVTTSSNAIATPGSYQPALKQNSQPLMFDGYIVKFDATGARQWGTYYGDTLDDWTMNVKVAANGDVVVCGVTWAVAGNTVMATPGAFQPALATHTAIGGDAFLSRFTSAGARIWSTYFGGTESDAAFDCGIDQSGDIYITGVTKSPGSSAMASSGCHQPAHGGFDDAFLAKFSATGSRIWSTYFGGVMNDESITCAIDPFGNVYISGATASFNNISTPGSHQQVHTPGRDVFLSKFDPSGVQLWGTYYGGNSTEDYGFCSTDSKGSVYLSGATSSTSLGVISSPCAYQQVFGGGVNDAFVAKFDMSGLRLWSTYYGDSGDESFTNSTWGTWYPIISTDNNDDVYLCGALSQPSNPLVIASAGGYQPAYGGGSADGYLVKFDGCRGVTLPADSLLTMCAGKQATISVNAGCGTSWYAAPGVHIPLGSGSLITGPLLTDTTFYAEDHSCGAGLVRTPVHVTVNPTPSVTASASSTMICAGESVTLSAGGAVKYEWLVPEAAGGAVVHVTPSVTGEYTVTGTGMNGCEESVVLMIVALPCLGTREESPVTHMQLFPNPNNGVFNVTLFHGGEVTIVNCSGQAVRKLSASTGNSYAVDLSDLPAGLYLLRSEDNPDEQLKLVITK